jgi:hypothetical protein
VAPAAAPRTAPALAKRTIASRRDSRSFMKWSVGSKTQGVKKRHPERANRCDEPYGFGTLDPGAPPPHLETAVGGR